ncbi:MAG: hypothetical protein KAF91_20480 [Nostoc sp. TH1S01]|nr:hypothetical protein [Nostoc sp. TH1S01]
MNKILSSNGDRTIQSIVVLCKQAIAITKQFSRINCHYADFFFEFGLGAAYRKHFFTRPTILVIYHGRYCT